MYDVCISRKVSMSILILILRGYVWLDYVYIYICLSGIYEGNWSRVRPRVNTRNISDID